MLVDGGVLTGEANQPAHRFGILPHVGPGDHRLTLVRLEQGGQDRDCGRLAGAIGPEKAKHDALGDDEVETGQRGDFLVPLDQARCLDHVGHGFLLFLCRDLLTIRPASPPKIIGPEDEFRIRPGDDWNHALLWWAFFESRQ